jgi:hypothetical protein
MGIAAIADHAIYERFNPLVTRGEPNLDAPVEIEQMA